MRIAIDCEFSFDEDNEFYLVCAAVTQEDGQEKTWWRDQLEDLREYIVAHKSDTWVAHNVECAEGFMWQSLGLRPSTYRWHDTLMSSRVVHNKCAKTHMKHSLADCLKREHIADMDVDAKHEDQAMCVWRQDVTWGAHLAKLESNKEHLMAYCLSDTKYLIQLDESLESRMAKRMPLKGLIDRAPVLEPERRSGYYGTLAALASEISWRGIPLNPERVSAIRRNAPASIARMQEEFLQKYPGTFRRTKNKLTKSVAECREYAGKVYGNNPPRTATGNISLASEHTKPHKDTGDFLGDYYTMDKQCRALASFAKQDREKNWLGMFLPKRNIIRPRINLCGTATGRAGSKPSSGFIPTMGKTFRGLMDPPEGMVLVELDYHSEEIGVQAYLTDDKTMASMYEGPDYYTQIAQSIDPTVKDKHDPRRKTYKIISLMSNYGCGVAHLAEIAKIPERDAKKILDKLKRMFSRYWKYVAKHTSEDIVSSTQPLWFSDGFRIYNCGGKVTSLGNWPFQGAGARILRELLIEFRRAHIDVVAPVHDALIFLAPESDWESVANRAADIMRDVSRKVLGTAVDVGDPEVTYHNIVNCHSEMSTREQYATVPDNKYKEQFLKYLEVVDTELVGDTVNLYVDEKM